MRFTIISSKADQQPPQSSCDFYTPGGTIGRGTDNNLVLPDSDRAISRLQAIVHVAADGECHITNRGNVTRVILNDIPLERGRQVELQDGDILAIGEYRIEVTDLLLDTQPVSRWANLAPPAAPANPARPAARAAPLAAPVKPAPAQPAPAQPAPQASADEAEPTAVPTEIWDSLMQEFSISDSISTGKARPRPAAEHDPFDVPEPAGRNPEDPLALFNDSEPLFQRPEVETDKLFTDATPFNKESIFDDVTPSALVPPAEQPPAKPAAEASEDELDPLALFGGGSAKSARHDDPLGLMGGAPLTPVDAAPSTEPLQPEPEPLRKSESDEVLAASPLFPESSAAEAEDAQAAGPSRFEQDLSARHAPAEPQDVPPAGEIPPSQDATPRWEAPQPPHAQPESPPQPEHEDLSGITLPTPQTVTRHAAQTPKGRLRIDPVQNSGSGQDPQSQPASGDVLQGELLEALLEGMGLGDMQPVPQFDRENMRQLGQMMSMFSQGTVALLSSRSILKRGVKADMTMVLDDANNPFKLLPSGKTVLMQMFGARMPGFMPPKKSVRDALIDLQAHQLGMISGIRAIIAAMLQSFNPEQLEEEAKRDGATSRLSLSSTRKAAMWDYFVRTYGETAGEIEDDFHTLFGEAFLYAYDMEVNQYKDSQSGSEE